MIPFYFYRFFACLVVTGKFRILDGNHNLELLNEFLCKLD